MQLDGDRGAPRPRLDPVGVQPLGVYERRGDGHTLARHCGITPEVEAQRLERHRGLPATGSFPDAATAQRCVETCVDVNRVAVQRWRGTGGGRLALAHDLGEVIGDVLLRRRLAAGDSTPLPATAVRVILRRNRWYPQGYAVLTAYPVLAAPYPPNPAEEAQA